jgi:hypothetical protein
MDFEEWYDNRIWGNEDFKEACWAAWDAAAEAERDACAKVVLDGNYWNGAPADVYATALDRAKAIRARSNA